MTNEMKLEIAKLRADGYTVDVQVDYNTDKWDEYIKQYELMSVALAWCGGVSASLKRPSDFFTIDYKVTKKPIKPRGNQFSEGASNE